MKHTRTRILSILLALMMCLSLLPVTALAADDYKEIRDDVYVPTSHDGKPLVVEGLAYFTAWLNRYDGGNPKPVGGIIVGGKPDVNTTLDERIDVKDFTITLIYAFPDGTSATETVNMQKYTLSRGMLSDERYRIDGGIGGHYDYAYYYLDKPAQKFAGYTFAGWDIDDQAGHTGYLPGMLAKDDPAVDVTYTARWKSVPSSILFESNGGVLAKPDVSLYCHYGDWDGSNVVMLTDDSGVFSKLPSVTREGYTFDGWYTAQTGGTKVTDGANLRGYDGSLWAHWTKVDDAYTVKFSLNGAPGTVPEELKVSKDNGVMVLPADPVWAKHTFHGWISGDIVGNQITNTVQWKNGDKVTSDLTLYAAWTEGEAGDALKGLTYRFSNSRSDFGYSSNYKIPLSRYQMVFGNVARAEYLYNWAGTWGGSCFGMVSTAGMFFQDGDIPETSFRSGAKVPYDLTVTDKNSGLNMTLTEYIEAVHVSQYVNKIQSDYRIDVNLNTLCDAVKSFKETGKNVPMVCIAGDEGGHAVLGYDVVDVSSTETHLMIYDPNYPNTERYITLTKDASGNYTSWYYKMNNRYDWGTGRSKESIINYVPYSDYLQAWASRAQKTNTASSNAMLNTNISNISITDSTGAVVATVKNGELTTNNSNIYRIRTVGLTADGSGSASAGILLNIPVGEYTVTNTGTEKSFEVSMVDVDQSATVTTGASSVTFFVDDSKTANSVQVNGAGESYDITLSSTLNQGYKDVVVTGTTSAEATAVAQISGKLYGTNLDTKGSIKVDGKTSDSNILAGTVPDAVPSDTSSNAPTTTPAVNRFTDVKSSDYYYDAVLWAVENGVTAGTGDGTTFSPNDPCTRSQIVTFLWRAYGKQKPTSTENPFTDVKPGDYYYDAVLWAVEKGITDGTGDGTTFSPNDPCTRSQAVTFQWRAASKPTVSGGSSFTDVTSGSYYADAVAWAVKNSITAGTGDGTTFSPNDPCTRAQIVTFLYRELGK